EAVHYSIRELALRGREKILLGVVHLGSKLFRSEPSQGAALRTLAEKIREIEDERGHRRTVLVGDFNMNPFEPEFVLAEGLNAVMTREVAGQGTRVVDRREHPFFYNPMW